MEVNTTLRQRKVLFHCSLCSSSLSLSFSVLLSHFSVKPAVEALKHKECQAIVAFHPSFVVPEDAPQLKGKGAMLWQIPETDGRFPPELRAVFEKELAAEPKVKFNTYHKCTHGFGSRPTGEIEIAAQKLRAEDGTEHIRGADAGGRASSERIGGVTGTDWMVARYSYKPSIGPDVEGRSGCAVPGRLCLAYD